MNIFILGVSGSGKTPIAKLISSKKNMNHISASEYFRKKFNKEFNDRNVFIKEITEFSKNELSKDPYLNIKYLKERLDNCVIEGIRNPIDFSNLFNLKEDKVIFLNYKNNRLKKTNFENGLDIINNIIKWSIINNLMENKNFIYIEFECFFGKNSLEEKIKELLNGTL